MGQFRYWSFDYSKFTGLISRNRGHSVVAIIIRLLPPLGGKTSPIVVKVIKTTLASLWFIAKTQGIKGLVKYLKNVSILTQQVIGGHKNSLVNPRVKTTRSGIPRLFPVIVRNGIRRSSIFYIKFALTISSIYRDLIFKGKINISSITDPFNGSLKMINKIVGFVPKFVILFLGPSFPEGARHLLYGTFLWVPILKSSPQSFGSLSSTNPLVMIRSAGALALAQIENLKVLFALSARKHLTGIWFTDPIARLELCRKLNQKTKFLWKSGKFTGKLGLKQEAAGKVRVFAMIDPWTQLAMLPLHRGLFYLLSKHPDIDGTFDQLAPIKRIPKGKPLYSMDLSSATDRLPISIQVPLIKTVFNLSEVEANAWKELLIERSYKVPNSANVGVKSVTYAVGQPMGALSSWAMLAFTHHLIVQFAADRVYGGISKLFRDYFVLGDDIVIYDSLVAKEYHNIITSIGVECNLSKSIISPKGTALEFAKRTFFMGIDVSPTPIKELAAALVSIPALLEYTKKYNLTLPGALKVAGFGFRVIGGLNKPFEKLNIKVRYFLLGWYIANGSPIWWSFIHLRRQFSNPEFILSIVLFFEEYVNTFIARLTKSIDKANQYIPDGVPKTVEHSISSIYWSDIAHIALPFGLQMQSKVIRNLTQALNKIKLIRPDIAYIKRRALKHRLDEVYAAMPWFSKQLGEILKLEQKASSLSIQNIFYREDANTPSRRPGYSKLFRMHQSYWALLNSFKNSSWAFKRNESVVTVKGPGFIMVNYKPCIVLFPMVMADIPEPCVNNFWTILNSLWEVIPAILSLIEFLILLVR